MGRCSSQRRTTRRKSCVGRDVLQRVERDIMLQIVDAQWKDHLYSLDHLKEGIGLRGYGQRDPLVEYKKESFELFQAMKDARRRGDRPLPVVAAADARATRRRPAPRAAPRRRRVVAAHPERPGAAGAASVFGAPRPPRRRAGAAARPRGAAAAARVGGDDAAVKTVRREEPKVGRNDPCPCGSGKKYKKCHGAAA